MFLTVVSKEIIGNLLSFRFTITTILCVLLMSISSYTLRERYERQLNEYNTAVANHLKSFKETSKHYMTSIYVLDKQPAQLSMFANGLEGIGKTVSVATVGEPTFNNSDVTVEPLSTLFGALDLEFIIRVVISLLALLFTYDAIAGEREQGTLKLTLANSIPRDVVILGKAVGNYVSLLVPFGFSVLIGLGIIVLSPQVHFDGEMWQRLLAAGLVALLYIWVFTAIGLFISVCTQRSATALLSLLLIWVVFVLAVPKASNLLAGQIYRIPSIQEIQGQKSTISHRINNENLRDVMKIGQRTGEEVEKEWRAAGKDIHSDMEGFQSAVSSAVMKKVADMQKQVQDKINAEWDKIQLGYDRQRRKQLELAINFSRISPASSYLLATTSIANTGLTRQQSFLRDTKQYQREFANYTTTKMAEGTAFLDPTNPQAKLDLSDMPLFDAKPPTFDASLSEAWVDILLLAFMGILFFMAAYVSFVRQAVQ